METTDLELPDDPRAALEAVREASRRAPALVLKTSPICPVSTWVERDFDDWLDAAEGAAILARVDVLARKPLARGLTAELDIRHESPQLLWFENGELRWHASHGEVNRAKCDELWASRSPA